MELKQLKRDVLYRGRIFDLIVDEVEYPSGNRAIREIAHHPGGAATVPLFEDGRVILIKQLRYPFGRYLYELPAGKLGPSEDPAIAAVRELKEETGWVGGKLEKLASVYTTPGFCDEVIHIYLATNLVESPEGHKREEGELTMSLHFIPLEDALGMIISGDIQDSKTIIGLFMTQHRLSGKR